MLNALIIDNLQQIHVLFKTHKVNKAYAFGSVCTSNFNKESDVDLLVSFEKNLDPVEYGTHYFQLAEELESILKRKVDLLTEKSLKNTFFIDQLNSTKISIL